MIDTFLGIAELLITRGCLFKYLYSGLKVVNSSHFIRSCILVFYIFTLKKFVLLLF
jgi:hypothetical protein